MTLTIVLCGSREWNNFYEIRAFLKSLLLEFKAPEIIVVHGGCRGADKIGGFIAKTLGMNVFEEKADWMKYGKNAGPIRNKLMLDKYDPDLVVAFHNDLEHSKGTKDMVERSKMQGRYTKVISCFSSDNRREKE